MPHLSARSARSWMPAAVAVAVSVWPAWAQAPAGLLVQPRLVPPPVPAHAERLDALVNRLDDPDWQTRHLATFELLTSDEIPLRQLEARLRDEALSAEQRARLRLVIRSRFFDPDSRAGMGIHLPPANTPGVPINPTDDERFHASQVLQPGDVVLRVDGEPLHGADDLRRRIVAADPGDAMVLDLMRAGREVTVTVRLGRFRDLGEGAQIDQAVLAEAWALRAAGLARDPDLPEPIDTGLHPDAWRDAPATPFRAARTQVDRARSIPTQAVADVPTVMMGGELGPPWVLYYSAMLRSGMVR